MTIKSLLLGSAALLSAISSAEAADAIVAAEPEPLEYVRICDAYGAGYFYIPGTETCVRIGGYVRTQLYFYDAYNPNTRYGTRALSRFEPSIATATDTEYGALKTYAEMRFDWEEGAAVSPSLIYANISLGGFLVGKQDSQFSIFTGNAGGVSSDDVVSYGPATKDLNQLTYIYNGGGSGISAMISLEDVNSGTYVDSKGVTQKNVGANGEDASDHYAPDAVAGILYKDKAWSVGLVGGYDSVVEQGAIKARVDADFGVFKAFLMGGWNTDGDKLNKYAPAKSGYKSQNACTNAGVAKVNCGWGDWALWTGASVPLGKTLTANLQVAYTDTDILAVAANVDWKPIKNLLIRPEVTYTNWDKLDHDQWAGTLRFQRNF